MSWSGIFLPKVLLLYILPPNYPSPTLPKRPQAETLVRIERLPSLFFSVPTPCLTSVVHARYWIVNNGSGCLSLILKLHIRSLGSNRMAGMSDFLFLFLFDKKRRRKGREAGMMRMRHLETKWGKCHALGPPALARANERTPPRSWGDFLLMWT